MDDITVVIPHLPERSKLLGRQLVCIKAQTLRPRRIVVESDPQRTGAAATRNRALARVRTPLVAFADDDDTVLPHWLASLHRVLRRTHCGLVHSDFEVIGAPEHRPSFIPVTNLVRTDAVRSVGGFPQPQGRDWPYRYEDWGLLAKLLTAGYVFRKVHEVTWRYHMHEGNTVGTGF